MARVNKASTTLAKRGAKLEQVVAALQESQEKLRQMFESVTDGISVIDLNGIITEVNQRTVEMHGFKSRDELLGRSAFELVAPRDHERIAANMRRAVKAGTVRGVEYTLLRADGSEFPGELSTSILKDVSGRRVGHITIARDITERKRMEQEIQNMNEQLKLQSKELVAGVGAVMHRAESPPSPEGGGVIYSDDFLSVDIAARKVMVGGKRVRLTPVEFRLLALLMQNAGRILTHRQLLEKVWGWEYINDLDYIRIYVWHLRQKIEPDPAKPRYILTEPGVGYYFHKAD